SNRLLTARGFFTVVKASTGHVERPRGARGATTHTPGSFCVIPATVRGSGGTRSIEAVPSHAAYLAGGVRQWAKRPARTTGFPIRATATRHTASGRPAAWLRINDEHPARSAQSAAVAGRPLPRGSPSP